MTMDILSRTPFIRLEHGSGGALSRELVEELIYPILKSDTYTELNDAACISAKGDLLYTTDTYVIDPPFFPGGDIGKLAVFGTCNDLAVSGGKPDFLSVGLVLEEGFPLDQLKKILRSASSAAGENGVSILTGDTKVVPQGKGGGIFINTSGIGERRFPGDLSVSRITPGDRIIVSGPVGSHGITVLAAREHLSVGNRLESDCAFLFPLCESLYPLGKGLRFMRDATRGGLSAILNEIVSQAPFGIEAEEVNIPVLDPVRSVSDILGLNPLDVANEGVFVAVVAPDAANSAIEKLSRFETGKRAAVIGRVIEDHAGKVVLGTEIGGTRILDFPRGLLLPRIC